MVARERRPRGSLSTGIRRSLAVLQPFNKLARQPGLEAPPRDCGSVSGMLTRRDFLAAVGAVPLVGLARPAISSAAADDIHTALNGPVGLQLWSVRKALSKDFNGTLTKVRAMGFEEVEAAGLYDRSPLKFRQALEKAGLRCQSVHLGYEQFRERPAEADTRAGLRSRTPSAERDPSLPGLLDCQRSGAATVWWSQPQRYGPPWT